MKNYKKKYEEVIKQIAADEQISQEVAEKYFPELKEDEDERIRKDNKDLDLLFEDLSSRLKYTVKGLHRGGVQTLLALGLGGIYMVEDYQAWFSLETVIFKPFLRPLSSITEIERKELLKFGGISEMDDGEILDIACIGFERHAEVQSWLDSKGFDYRGLIEKGLALNSLTFLPSEK